MEHSGGKGGGRDCLRAVDLEEGSLLEVRSSTKPLASTLTSTIKKPDYENAMELRRTVSDTLYFGPCSSDHDREVAFRGGSYPVGHSSAAHQPMCSVCYWGLRGGSHSVGHLISVLGVERSLGGEN